MDTGPWTVLSDAERDQWQYVPGQTLGPLRFGMTWKEAVVGMVGGGFAQVPSGTQSGWRVTEFRKRETFPGRAEVKCYFDKTDRLAYVLVDGRKGPQVTCAGIRLIGRVPSELEQEMAAHADEHDTGIRFGYGGDAFCDGFELEPGTQRAGDNVVTWALFFGAGDDHSVARDATPRGVWHHS